MFELDKIIRPNIAKLQPYSSARDEFNATEGIFLDANENPFGTLNRYPDPYQMELKKRVAERTNARINNIFLGNGSDEVIDLVFRMFCTPGIDKALAFSPTYGMYQVSADINNVELISEALDEHFDINLKSLTPRFSDKNLKLILICSPNNPTGNCQSKKSIETILQRFNGLVLVDEAYIDFAPEQSVLELINRYPNLIVTRTLSKAWGLAAARIGMAFAQQDIITYFNKVKPPYNISEPNQKAAIQALSDSDQFQTNFENILSEKLRLEKELAQLAIVKKIYPSATNFLLIEVNDADLVYQSLINQKVIIRNRNKQIKNCLRITVGSTFDNNQLIQSLKQIQS